MCLLLSLGTAACSPGDDTVILVDADLDTPPSPDAPAPPDAPASPDARSAVDGAISDAPRADATTFDVASDAADDRPGLDVAPSARLPRGALDNADCRGVWGWALDDDAPLVSLSVRVRVEGLDLRGEARTPRPDVCAPTPGPCDHGFDVPVPAALQDGRDHAITVYARDATDGREGVIAMGTLRCGDAGVSATDVPATVDVPATPDVAVTGDDRIQTELTQECTDGDGVTFRVRPTHPVRGIAGYSFAWRVTEGSTRLSLNDTRDRAHVVLVGDGVPNSTHLELTITRPGYRTLVVPPSTLWSSACAHEFNPTRCPENTRSVETNSEYYARGQSFTARAVDAAAGDVNWYANVGLDGVTYDAASHAMRATVTSDPAATLIVTQAQPFSDPRTVETARCHGWTQRYFVLR